MNDEPLSRAEIESLLGPLAGLPPADISPASLIIAAEPGLPAALRSILQSLHVQWGTIMSASLRPLLRRAPEVGGMEVRETTWCELGATTATPGCYALLDTSLLKPSPFLEIGRSILYPMLDRMLGGTGRDWAPQRPLTLIEMRLATRIAEVMVEAWRRAWLSLVPLEARVEGLVGNLSGFELADKADAVIVVECQLTIGTASGLVRWCFAAEALIAIADQLAPLDASGEKKGLKNRQPAGRAEKPLGGATVELVAQLTETHITPDELADLEVGDIITTRHATGDPVIVTIEGITRFQGRIGQQHGRLAVRIAERLAGKVARHPPE